MIQGIKPQAQPIKNLGLLEPWAPVHSQRRKNNAKNPIKKPETAPKRM